MIFDEHEAWLRDGGSEAIEAVKQANWAAVINRHLAHHREDVIAALARSARACGAVEAWHRVLEAHLAAVSPNRELTDYPAPPQPDDPLLRQAVADRQQQPREQPRQRRQPEVREEPHEREPEAQVEAEAEREQGQQDDGRAADDKEGDLQHTRLGSTPS
jgi:hypothetical protein